METTIWDYANPFNDINSLDFIGEKIKESWKNKEYGCAVIQVVAVAAIALVATVFGALVATPFIFRKLVEWGFSTDFSTTVDDEINNFVDLGKEKVEGKEKKSSEDTITPLEIIEKLPQLKGGIITIENEYFILNVHKFEGFKTINIQEYVQGEAENSRLFIIKYEIKTKKAELKEKGGKLKKRGDEFKEFPKNHTKLNQILQAAYKDPKLM